MHRYILAGPEHLDDICCIESSCFKKPWSKKSIEEMLGNSSAIAVIAVIDNETAGYVGAYIGGDVLYINNIGVLPAFRRKGIAKALLNTLFRYAAEYGAVEATLEVRQSNTAARNLYGCCGFAEAGIRKSYYTEPEEDAVIMNLTGVGTYVD